MSRPPARSIGKYWKPNILETQYTGNPIYWKPNILETQYTGNPIYWEPNILGTQYTYAYVYIYIYIYIYPNGLRPNPPPCLAGG